MSGGCRSRTESKEKRFREGEEGGFKAKWKDFCEELQTVMIIPGKSEGVCSVFVIVENGRK